MTRRLLRKRGSDALWQIAQRVAYAPDFGERETTLFEKVSSFTMTSPERAIALADAVRHIVDNHVPGSIVECGVWRGGSMMVVAETLLALDAADRDLYLFDTYAGMSRPSAHDTAYDGTAAAETLASQGSAGDTSNWCMASAEEVAHNMARTGYPAARVKLVRGKVEETIPQHAPQRIALLRLDTDWYESTRHELEHLYDRLEAGGVLIIDDYGHWQGARRAVDEFFAARHPRPLLARIDYTARICVKT